jgi:hypothetical protein
MRSKTSRQDEEPTLLGRVYERGEETLGQLLDDLFGRGGVVRQLRETADRASEARRRLDRNLQFLLKVLNVPSRADYERLLARIDGLQGSLLNVSMKLDRLMAMQAHRPSSSPAPKRPPVARRRRSMHAHTLDEKEADADG